MKVLNSNNTKRISKAFHKCLLANVFMFALGSALLFHSIALESRADGAGIATFQLDCAFWTLIKLVEGSFGALIMVVAGIGTIVASAFGAYRSATSLIVVALAAFLLRGFTMIFFSVGPDSAGCFSAGVSSSTARDASGSHFAPSGRDDSGSWFSRAADSATSWMGAVVKDGVSDVWDDAMGEASVGRGSASKGKDTSADFDVGAEMEKMGDLGFDGFPEMFSSEKVEEASKVE